MTERRLFGTDGIRGIANKPPMTPETVLKIGRAVASVFSDKGNNTRIVIGKDTRQSCGMLEGALVSGICSMGADAVLAGEIPTPAVAYLTKILDADAGIVISASHNPAEHNGIKVFSHGGFKLPDETEVRIEELMVSGMPEPVEGKRIGRVSRVDNPQEKYIEFAKSSISQASLSGVKAVLDCANGAACSVAPAVLKALGAEVIAVNTEPDGLNINRECGALHPETIQRLVKESQADIGIALDGDADRIRVCDEKSNILDGDDILAIAALDMKQDGALKHDTIVATVLSNLCLDSAMSKAGIKVIRTKVGDRYVAEEMRKNGYSLGGEESGHIIFLDHSTTGDGIITGLQILAIMKKQGKKLSDLAGCMVHYPKIMVNIDVGEKKDFGEMHSVMEKIKEIEKRLGGEGRVLVRYSGTEMKARVMVEGKDNDEIKEMAGEIAEEIKKEAGACRQ